VPGRFSQILVLDPPSSQDSAAQKSDSGHPRMVKNSHCLFIKNWGAHPATSITFCGCYVYNNNFHGVLQNAGVLVMTDAYIKQTGTLFLSNLLIMSKLTNF